MYEIKKIPEDFVVEEILDLKLCDGPYSYFLLEKKGMTTQKAIEISSKLLSTSEKYVNFAGTKDRQAVTKQIISVFNCTKRENFNRENFSLTYLGQGKERINLGSNKGNKFKIVVRNLESKKSLSVQHSINYFDEQRFSKANVKIGLCLLRGEFKVACDLIESPSVNAHLLQSPNDFAGALKKVPKKLLSMYVSAFQSVIWNKTVASFITKYTNNQKSIPYSQGIFLFPPQIDQLKNQIIPLVGFGSELSGEVGKIIEELLLEEKIDLRDFIIKKIPDLSSEGAKRKMIVDVANFSYSYKDDELNLGKIKCIVEFSIPSGSYATIVIRSIFD